MYNVWKKEGSEMKFTVKELIEELQCYEENRIVWLQLDNMQTPISNIELDEEDTLIIK